MMSSKIWYSFMFRRKVKKNWTILNSYLLLYENRTTTILNSTGLLGKYKPLLKYIGKYWKPKLTYIIMHIISII